MVCESRGLRCGDAVAMTMRETDAGRVGDATFPPTVSTVPSRLQERPCHKDSPPRWSSPVRRVLV